MKRLAAGVLLLTALAGCANRSYVVLLEDPQGGVGKIVLVGKQGTQTIDQAMLGADLTGSQAPQPVDPKRFEEDFGAVLAARPVLPQRYLLYFQSGGTELTAESQALLASILQDVSQRPVADVSVIGHTDAVGNPQANEALGLQRAQGIAALLVDQGMKAFALSVESHGERDPLVPTADEVEEPRNRRVEISVR